jgi:tetratricopeptide (TPR) repeat protein
MLPKVITKLAVASVIWTSAIAVMAQAEHPLPRPQARTEEEFDLYLEFVEAADPEAKHEMALRFEGRYPKSELLVNVYENEFEYARSHEQLQPAIAAAEKALRLEPDDARALVDIAEVLPRGTSELLTLSKAEEYARKAMVELKDMRFSHDVPVIACEDMRSTLLSRAHTALGYILGKRGELPEAIKELETAVAVNPEPTGAQFLLAGRLYRLAQRNQDAMKMFRRAANAGPTAITSLANSELAELGQAR